jgi:Ca2+-binding EF-hand superfamily protein
VAYLLRLCDHDGDDVLEASDFEEWVDRLAALRGWEPGTEGYTALYRLYVEEAFGGVAAESGRDDGRVALGAMGDFLIAVANEHAPEFRAWADALFDVLDRDGDGVIGREEHRDLLASLLVARHVADVSFAHIDAGGSGRLTRAQFRELYRGFFVAEDPEAPATWFWGRTDAAQFSRLWRRP